MGAGSVSGMEIRSVVAGAFATVAVAGLAFTWVATANADEAPPAEPTPVATETVTPTPEPTVTPTPTVVPEPASVVVPEVVVEAPAPAPEPAVRVDPPIPPATPPAIPGSPPETPLCELPPEGYVGILVDGRMPRADGQPCHTTGGQNRDGVWYPDL